MPEFLTNNTDPVVEHDSLGVPSAPDDNGRWWSSVEISPNDLKGALQKLWDNSLASLHYIKQLTGPAGTIGNVTDVDDSAKSNGFVLSYSTDVDPPKWLAVPLETGVLVLRSGDDKLDELLTDNQRTLESGTTGWQADTNCTITQSATQTRTGSNSLRLESSAAGNLRAITLPGYSGWDATAQSVYYGEGYSRAQSTGRDSGLGFAFYDGSGTLIGTIAAGTVSANNNSGWTQHTVQATAPAGTVTGALVTIVEGAAASGEQFYFDDFTVRGVLVSRKNLNLRGAVIDSPSTNAVTFYSGGGRIKQVSSDYTIQQNDDGATLEIDATGAARTITLPNSIAAETMVMGLKTAGGNDVTFTAEGTLVGASGTISGEYSGLRLYKRDATTWVAIPFSGGGIGQIIQASSAPTDGTWLACDGGVYLQATYPALFEKIGLIYDDVNPDATSTGGAFSAGDLGVNTADKAFDNSAGTSWISSQSGASIVDTAWLSNDLTTAQLVSRVEFTNNNNADRMPTAFDVQGADDAAFTTNVVSHAVTGIVQSFSAAWGFDIPTPFTRRYIRAIAREQTPIGGNWAIAEMRVVTLGTTYNSTTEFIVPTIPISGQQVVSPFYIKAAN